MEQHILNKLQFDIHFADISDFMNCLHGHGMVREGEPMEDQTTSNEKTIKMFEQY